MTHHIRVGDEFWNFERSPGVTFPQAVRKLTRLATRFAKRDSVEDTINQFVIEKLLQMLPQAAAIQIRRENPKTPQEAAVMAQHFFQDRHSDPDDPKWKRSAGKGRQSYSDLSTKNYRDYQGSKDDGRGSRDDRHYGGHAPHNNTHIGAATDHKEMTGRNRDKKEGPNHYHEEKPFEHSERRKPTDSRIHGTSSRGPYKGKYYYNDWTKNKMCSLYTHHSSLVTPGLLVEKLMDQKLTTCYWTQEQKSR